MSSTLPVARKGKSGRLLRRPLEWAPWAGHDQAASLTGGRACFFSYWSGLR